MLIINRLKVETQTTRSICDLKGEETTGTRTETRTATRQATGKQNRDREGEGMHEN